MKHYKLLLLIFFFSSIVFQCLGQHISYLDSSWIFCNKSEAVYYRTIKKKKKQDYIVTDSYMSTHKPQMIAHVSNIQRPITKEGTAQYFWENGNKKSEGNYHENQKYGKWITWDEDGKDSSVTICNKDSSYTYVRICPKQIEDSIYNKNFPVLVLPQFPGGNDSLFAFIKKNTVYPKAALMAHISGTCYVSFTITTSGAIENIKLLRGIPNSPSCDAESIRVVSIMPTWVPGKKTGKPQLPISNCLLNIPSVNIEILTRN